MAIGTKLKKQTRRRVLFGGAALLVVGGIVWQQMQATAEPARFIDPLTALQRAQADEIILVDIRRPDEWHRTGVAVGAHRLDMRRPDFLAEIKKLTSGAPDKPIALICAAGVRSAYVAQALAEAGYADVLDVSEGMMGSKAGIGWLRRGLPVVRD